MEDGEKEVGGWNAVGIMGRVDFMLSVFESAPGEDEGEVLRLVGAGGHPATVKNRRVIEESAPIDGVFLRLEEIDEIGHHFDLIAFDFFQGGHGIWSFAVVGKSMVASVESEVSVGESGGQGDGAGRVGLQGKGDDLDGGLELLCGAVAGIGFRDVGLGLGPVDPGLLLDNFLLKKGENHQ